DGLNGGGVGDGEGAEVEDPPQLEGLGAVGGELGRVLREVHDGVTHHAVLLLTSSLYTRGREEGEEGGGRGGRGGRRERSEVQTFCRDNPLISHRSPVSRLLRDFII